MARKPSLADAIASPELPPPAVPVVQVTKPVTARPPSRAGRKGVAFWVDPAAARQLRMIAAEEDRTTQSLMEEALDLLFQTRGRHRLARPPA
jgi:hypothetical protein